MNERTEPLIRNCATCEHWRQEEKATRDIDERGTCSLAAVNWTHYKETGELRTMAAYELHTEFAFVCRQHTPKAKSH